MVVVQGQCHFYFCSPYITITSLNHHVLALQRSVNEQLRSRTVSMHKFVVFGLVGHVFIFIITSRSLGSSHTV